MKFLARNFTREKFGNAPAAPVVSIIICTHNRALELRKTMQSIVETEVPAHLPAELIVVDNASTDATREVVESFSPAHLAVRYLYEPRIGKCNACNQGIAAARGSILLFTDEDLRYPRNWIAGMCEPIVQGKVDAVAGGVRLAPHLVRAWMTPFLRMMFAETARLDPVSPTDMIGANMAIARRVFKVVPGFDSHLGPGRLGTWEETLLSYQIIRAGFKIGAALDVEIEHHFNPQRLKRRELLKFAASQGRSHAYVLHHWDHEMLRWRRAGWFLRWARVRWLEVWHRLFGRSEEGCTDVEFLWARSAAMYRQFAQEALLPRKYSKHGLVSSAAAGPEKAVVNAL